MQISLKLRFHKITMKNCRAYEGLIKQLIWLNHALKFQQSVVPIESVNLWCRLNQPVVPTQLTCGTDSVNLWHWLSQPVALTQ